MRPLVLEETSFGLSLNTSSRKTPSELRIGCCRKHEQTQPAKNLILAGVKSVTLHDVGTVELWDMSSNFVFSENDVGKNRALASVAKLQELNNAVVVQSLTSELTKEQLADFQGSLLLSTLHTHRH